MGNVVIIDARRMHIRGSALSLYLRALREALAEEAGISLDAIALNSWEYQRYIASRLRTRGR